MRLASKQRIRVHLNDTLSRFSPMVEINRPAKGWIRAIRDALGMTMAQLADRLGVSKSRVPRIEQDEIMGRLTLKTMYRVAKELDCVFVYGFAPRTGLDQTVRKEAETIAGRKMKRLVHSMRLEAHGLSREQIKNVHDNMVEEIMNSPALLWKKQG